MKKLIQKGASRLADSNPFLQQLRVAKKDIEARLKQKAGKIIVPTNWADFASLCKIRSGNKMANFTPFDYQVKLVELMASHSVVQVVKSRQLGITQAALSRYLHKAILNPAYSGMSFMKSQEDASNLSRRTRVMLESISEYALAESDNLGYLKIAGGGSVYFKNSGKEGARSYDSIEDFLFDEAAFAPNIESIYSASSASSAMLGDQACKLIVSTPSAKIGWFWEMFATNNPEKIDPEEVCNQVANGDLPPFYYWVDTQGICKVVIHWKAHPLYSLRPDYLEYRQKKDGTSWEVVKREYDLLFINPDISVFDAALVKKCANGFLEEPQKDSEYYIGIDTSNLGGDYTVAVIIRKVEESYKVVSFYRKKRASSEYDIFHLGELIEKFKPEIIGIETTGGTGQVYLEQLQKNHKNYNFQGIKTTPQSKPAMIDRLILLMESSRLSYPNDSPIIEEMLVFKRSGNQLGAPSGKHDDCIMATAFAATVAEKNISNWDFSGVPKFEFEYD